MAFSGGTFSRLYDWTTDRDNGVKILASRMDQEFDGIATGLSTCILKDGTQTCTAAIPFAEGITLPDNKTIVLGTNSDITIQYDESTNDSLEIAANVEGAALGIVLKADQGDDNADQHKVGIADGGTLTMASKISGSFVSYLTHTPNSTVASSTTAVAGNLTVGGDLTLGSGAVISEAELEKLDGITNGTVAADKAVVVDSNKDIASFRNVTLTGELDAGSLDISGDADIDGTLEADAMTLNGTAITATATLDTGISNNNVPKFTSGVADNDFLRVDGTAIEGRSASEVLSDIGAQASLTFGISNTNAVKIDSSSVADDEYARFTANGLESRATSEVLSDIGAAPAAGSSNIVTTGALDSGSITSGFGTIDTGSSNITTTGLGTFGSVNIDGGAIDGVTIGTNSAVTDLRVDNLKLDGNTISSTDSNGAVTIDPNGTGNVALGNFTFDADQSVGAGQDNYVLRYDNSAGTIQLEAEASGGISAVVDDSSPQLGGVLDTNGNNIEFPDSSGAEVNRLKFGAGDDLQIYHDGNDSYINDTGTGNLRLAGSSQVDIISSGGEFMAKFIADGAATLYHDNAAKLNTSSTGAAIAGKLDVGSVGASGGTAGEVAFGGVGGSIDGFRIRNTEGNYLELSAVSSGNKMVLTNTGNVGIGTAAPAHEMHIQGSGTTASLSLKGSGTGTATSDGIELKLQGDNSAYLYNYENAMLRFGTNGLERVRLTADGNFLVGKTANNTDNAGFEVTSNGATAATRASGHALLVNRLTDDGSVITLRRQGTTVGTIAVTSSGTTYNTTSDIRLKQDIEPLQATDKLMQMNPVSYSWKADPDGPRSMGFIAQEMADVMPEAVSTGDDDDAMMNMDYGRITPILVSALQDAHRKIEQLEQRIADMEAK